MSNLEINWDEPIETKAGVHAELAYTAPFAREHNMNYLVVISEGITALWVNKYGEPKDPSHHHIVNCRSNIITKWIPITVAKHILPPVSDTITSNKEIIAYWIRIDIYDDKVEATTFNNNKPFIKV